jgi:hypothetical protein
MENFRIPEPPIQVLSYFLNYENLPFQGFENCDEKKNDSHEF